MMLPSAGGDAYDEEVGKMHQESNNTTKSKHLRGRSRERHNIFESEHKSLNTLQHL